MPSLTINYTTAEGNRFATAVGKAQNLGRDATAQECKNFVIQRMTQVVVDIEGGALTQAAIAAVVVPAFTPT